MREGCDDCLESARRQRDTLCVAGDTICTNADGLLLRPCLRILALDAAPASGTIEATPHHDGDLGGIALRDSGVGIPEALRGKLFEPGFTTKTNGHGVGLPIARRI